jgi:hypothetical protein
MASVGEPSKSRRVRLKQTGGNSIFLTEEILLETITKYNREWDNPDETCVTPGANDIKHFMSVSYECSQVLEIKRFRALGLLPNVTKLFAPVIYRCW